MTSMRATSGNCRNGEEGTTGEHGIEQRPLIAPLLSSFTAINDPHTQLCTPPQSSASLQAQQTQARRRVVIAKRRRRNPTVAQYLGLGPSSESNHLEQNVCASERTRSTSSASTSKRRELGNKNDATHPQSQSSSQTCSFQTRVSESLRVMKPRRSSATSSNVCYDEPLISDAESGPNAVANTSLRWGSKHSEALSQYSCHNTALQSSTASCVEYPVEVTPWLYTPEDRLVTPVHSNEIGNDIDVPDQIDRIKPSDNKWIFDDNEEEFNDNLNDEDFLELTSQVMDPSGNIADLPSSPCHSDSTHTVYVGEEYPGPAAKLPVSPKTDMGNNQSSSKKFVSPMTLTSRLLASTGNIDCAEARKPIARAPFPEGVRDRSPIIGLSSDTLLRTCFRVGEAINQAHQSSKNGKHIVFELYARILESSRTDTKQSFTFCDLFHGKPPYIKGLYDGAKWQSVRLFNYDGQRLLRQGRICRCMGTMKRDGKNWVMNLSSIWEAAWDDIKWVEGIVNA
ncbi:hypothetical protein DE146DRAFT_670095 [Phaeosphaeria sp. MPI-PUGE-AT-0046c]|nr:hypothetical protein DE146DRAFT_670095 [Phaeosphaeria sp. MPI-PUGE-AT-0046c]